MSFSSYPDYKDSGVEWLGEVPGHWEVLSGRRLFEQRRDPANPDDGQLSATQKYGVIPQALFMQLEDQKVTLALNGLDNFKHVEADDFVISLRSFQGGIEWSRYAGCVSPAYTVLRTLRQGAPPYWAYVLKSAGYIAALQSVTDGIRDGKNISYEQFGVIGLAVPDAVEQSAIAAFLDRETGKIDALVGEQEKLIELLKEKRQAVISHAVTKGLDPSVPMKDSGIEWLGEVPAHWEVVSLKHLVARPIIDGPHETPTKRDEGIPFISAEAVSQGVINFESMWGCISAEDHAEYSRRYSPKRGDILMVKLGATTGVAAIVETDDDFNIWVPLAAIRLTSRANPKFVLNVLRSDSLRMAYELNWTYGTQQTLGLRTISNLRIPVPPAEEQRAIVDYLDPLLSQFELLMAEALRAIELLKEHRSALISAAVTGKIDVRGLVSSQEAA